MTKTFDQIVDGIQDAIAYAGGDESRGVVYIEGEAKIYEHVQTMYGLFGGVGDPPDIDTVMAIIRSTVDYLNTES